MTISFRTPRGDYWNKVLRQLIRARRITIGAFFAYLAGCIVHVFLYGSFGLMGAVIDSIVFIYCVARVLIPIYSAKLELDKIGDVPMKCELSGSKLDTTVYLGEVPAEYTKKLSELSARAVSGYVVITGAGKDKFYLRIPFSAFEDDRQYDFIDRINR